MEDLWVNFKSDLAQDIFKSFQRDFDFVKKNWVLKLQQLVLSLQHMIELTKEDENNKYSFAQVWPEQTDLQSRQDKAPLGKKIWYLSSICSFNKS